MCPAPFCGGVFVKKVNRPLQRCPDGSHGKECLANLINWSALGLDPETEAALSAEFATKRIVVRGELVLDDSAIGVFPPLTILLVREAWRGVTGNVAERRFFGVVPSGIVCVTFPCPSFLKTRLNWSPPPRLFHELNLSRSGASDEEITQGFDALVSGGLIVSGHLRRIKGPGRPVFGENMRALQWVVERCTTGAEAIESPMGWVPPYEALNWEGLDFDKEPYYKIMNIDREIARREANDQEELFTRFGDHLPREMELERELQLQRLYHSPQVWDLAAVQSSAT